VVSAPENMPRKQSAFLQFVGKTLCGIHGWQIEGEIANEDKLIVALAPHTSNWDFYVGVRTIMMLDADVAIFMKKEAFFWPFNRLLQWFGFIPVDRKAGGGGVVGAAITEFTSRERFWLVITPEGTRKSGGRWKKGFLRMSKDANVPIQILSVDYPSKRLRFGEVIWAGDDFDKDIERCIESIAGFRGKG